LVLVDINEKSLHTATNDLTSSGYNAIGIVFDVADEQQVAAIVARTVSTFGRLDMAFNNAGIAGPAGEFTAGSITLLQISN
jgi:NAD(P)-dependent dehydrogenase (short-subunit alcohol dehydrogenase family)